MYMRQYLYFFQVFLPGCKVAEKQKKSWAGFNYPWALADIAGSYCHYICHYRRYSFQLFYHTNFMGHWYQYGYTGAMIWLPFYVVLFTGAAIVLGHNTIDFAASAHKGNLPFWWSLLHKQGEFNLWPGHKLFIFYPFLAWSGLMMLGYCCGKIFTAYEPVQRSRILLYMGLGLFFLRCSATRMCMVIRFIGAGKKIQSILFCLL